MYGNNSGGSAGAELESMGDGASPGGDTPHDTGAQYTLPADICPGMKEGDEMVLKIVSVKDGKYTVAYAPEEGKEGQESQEEGTPWEDDFRASMSAAAPQEGAA